MSHNSNLEDDEVDLRELFAALWSHKIFILVFTGFSIFLAGYTALTSVKIFTATQCFKLNKMTVVLALTFPASLAL